MLKIAFISGPGAGKSRNASKLYSQLKNDGINVELVREFAKDLTYQEDWKSLGDQLYITGEQSHREYILNDKVDVMITDSPLILGAMYVTDVPWAKEYEDLLVKYYKSNDYTTIFLKRDASPYQEEGRTQTEEESIQLDEASKHFMDKHEIDYVELSKDEVYVYVRALRLGLL